MRYQAMDEDWSRAIDATVEALADAECNRPPIDALELAEELGLWVAVDRRQSARGRLVRLAQPEPAVDHGAILLRPDPRPQRRQWACAHELGEHRAWEVFGRLGIDVCDAPDAARETVA